MVDVGLEEFIAARRAEGFTHVIISSDHRVIGWGRSPDEAWYMASYFARDRRHTADDLLDAQAYAADGDTVEDWSGYLGRHGMKL